MSRTEMDFTNADLENLHGMGANPITFKRNYGYCINAENTAAVFPVSSLSYIHSREVLIELENELYNMLLRYQWRFNTAAVRNEIKFRADHDLPFVLLSDPDHKVAEAYGAWGEKKRGGKTSMGLIRSHFGVDEEGALIEFELGVQPLTTADLALRLLEL